ncbi:MAG TPA: 4a-hydroxytetrahydrobiopterin dehydratase [Candidatus Poseidoniales archaeon]|jgi:4a-hydroxytetrahydrobiopterin dehydratase|nr:MAG: pterin-4-alpha-carbinolamine dehydratase [Euryarchaeota archaeon]HIF46641.1 4a-hydroxytetrahydrobiopterin dehydratase [Candidatus Poseidoniales archaeon]HIL65636.1 4a-hydroxytetrahydrobiopterin dehydratase [Candidatus Poseidoniales archaeon]
MSWVLIDDHHLEKKFKFEDFKTALEFLNRCGEICESQNHHAEFVLNWGSVLVKTWSHDIDGISSRDHILISAIDEVFS